MNSSENSGIMPNERHYGVTKEATYLIEGSEVCGTVLEDVLWLVAEDLARKVV